MLQRGYMTNIATHNFTNYTMQEWKDYASDKKHIKLSDQNLTDEHIVCLAEILKTNTQIRSIDLSKNKITDIGAKALAEAFRVNNFIAKNPLMDTHVILLHSNLIGKEGILSLINVFNETDRYEHCIVIDNNYLTEDEINEISVLPEVITFYEKTVTFRKQLYPSADCVIS